MCIHISINVHFLPCSTLQNFEAYAIISMISFKFSLICLANLGVAIPCIKNIYIYIYMYMHTIYMYIEKMNRKTIEYQPVSS